MPPPEIPGAEVTTFPGTKAAPSKSPAPVAVYCESCYFWRANNDRGSNGKFGACFRNPPALMNLGPIVEPLTGKPVRDQNGQIQMNIQPLRPVTMATDRACGEWQPPMGRER